MAQSTPPNATTFEGGLWMKDSSGNYVQVVGADGSIDAPVTTTDLTTTGNTTLGNAVTDTTAINGATTITTTSASGLTVGRQGATSPQLKVDASTTSVVTGLQIKGAASGNGLALSTIGGGTDENLKIDAKGAGTVTINGTATGIVILPAGTTIGGSSVAALGVVTSSSANALAVGPNGTTNPSFNVDASTASAATGLNIKSAAAAGGLAISVLSSGTDESLTLNAKGAGTITLNGTATGKTTMGSVLEITAAKGILNTVSGAQGSFMQTGSGNVAAVAAGAAIPLTNYFSKLDSNAGATTQTLAASTVVGLQKKILFTVDGGDDVVTVTSLSGGTTITFSNVGDVAELMWNGTNWIPLALYNCATGASTTPVLA